MDLQQLGWNDHFAQLAEEQCVDEQRPARVVIVDRDRYTLLDADGEHHAKLTGRLHHAAESPADFPCVGDWVCVDPVDAGEMAMIGALLPRATFLRRKAPGQQVEYQMIAANIDVALIVMSCHYDFNLRRLERYLVMVNEGGIEPWLILTKTDLVDGTELQRLIDEIQAMAGDITILPLSNITGDGVDALRLTMLPGKTYCLVGSSGVGKTTLINHLTDGGELATAAVSGTGEGRHTTVRRQLILLESSAMLIDTPGMRELGMLGASEGVDTSFADILELAKCCRFGDCSHRSEPGCAVRAAIDSGDLSQEYFNNYLKLKKENEYHDLSYAERRKKARDFGKMVHTVMKEHRKHR